MVSTSTLPAGLTPSEIDAVVTERLAVGEDLYRLDERALADLDAELVLTQDLCGVCAIDVERVDDALAYLGCSATVLTLDPHGIDDVLASIATVGEALGAVDAARVLVESLRDRLRTLASALDGTPSRPVLALEWTDPRVQRWALGAGPDRGGRWHGVAGEPARRLDPDLVGGGGGRAGRRRARRRRAATTSTARPPSPRNSSLPAAHRPAPRCGRSMRTATSCGPVPGSSTVQSSWAGSSTPSTSVRSIPIARGSSLPEVPMTRPGVTTSRLRSCGTPRELCLNPR